ncbi:ATP-binding cassette sub- F member 2 [Saguinus oedipus]|uniref:ATP-binding cassette sub- F member 2 n=1 Tax=Saguinus oedipus TaxID=9490 RepID=A0ABQ9UV51_SAGOE|nr:ATP-binding cassette sub- F member 2 [Saguinus oedipus]
MAENTEGDLNSNLLHAPYHTGDPQLDTAIGQWLRWDKKFVEIASTPQYPLTPSSSSFYIVGTVPLFLYYPYKPQVAEEKNEASNRETTEKNLLTKELEDFEIKKVAAQAATVVLTSHPNSTDTHIINLSLTFHGQELLNDTKLGLNSGCRYGLIDLNGIGKSMLLCAIGKCEVLIPEHFGIYHLT